MNVLLARKEEEDWKKNNESNTRNIRYQIGKRKAQTKTRGIEFFFSLFFLATAGHE